jgi:hypothetical protein
MQTTLQLAQALHTRLLSNLAIHQECHHHLSVVLLLQVVVAQACVVVEERAVM